MPRFEQMPLPYWLGCIILLRATATEDIERTIIGGLEDSDAAVQAASASALGDMVALDTNYVVTPSVFGLLSEQLKKSRDVEASRDLLSAIASVAEANPELVSSNTIQDLGQLLTDPRAAGQLRTQTASALADIATLRSNHLSRDRDTSGCGIAVKQDEIEEAMITLWSYKGRESSADGFLSNKLADPKDAEARRYAARALFLIALNHPERASEIAGRLNDSAGASPPWPQVLANTVSQMLPFTDQAYAATETISTAGWQSEAAYEYVFNQFASTSLGEQYSKSTQRLVPAFFGSDIAWASGEVVPWLYRWTEAHID